MITAEQARKRVRKNYKDRVRAAYKEIKREVELEINKTSTINNCYVEIDRPLWLAGFILMKKLERKGFKCELRKRAFAFTDLLLIYWGDDK